MKQEIAIIFPHQLFQDHPALHKKRLVYLIEHPRFFSDFSFNKQKLVLHRASMKTYYGYLRKKKYDVIYVENSHADLKKLFFGKNLIAHCARLVDHALEKEIAGIFEKNLIIHETPGFLLSATLIQEELGNKKHYLMNSFYIAQRKRLNILVQDGKPIGGKWSFDIQNRRKMPGALRVPEPMNIKQNKYVKEAVEYIKKHFDHNPGTIEEFIWPTNHDEAKKWLHNFLSRRLCLFGPYQDAIDPTKDFLFHSLLSPLLNIGLLTPAYVIDETLAYAHKHTVPLNCLEGFIRQIIGWREFVQGIYVLHGEKQRKSNFFKHTKKLPASFWDATTGILPIDNALQKIVKTGYAHHIERLMVLGNFMLLIEVDPNEVYRWFMELFIDAYDWVMVPNVYGMSQYADGGLMTTKPYFSSSNYIRAMSNYKNGSWCELWDALYWHFIVKNNSLIKKNARLSFINLYLRNKKKDILEKQLKIAQKYLKEI